MATTIYACLFVAAMTFLYATAEQSAFCGFPAMLLTLPWGPLMSEVVRGVAPRAFDSMTAGTIILILSAIINGCLLLTWRRWLGWLFPSPREGTEPRRD